MAKVGIMIEGQEDLTWDRWHRIIDRVEALGFESLWRSDHLIPLVREDTSEALEAWISFSTLAARTSTIRFGPMVSPVTFRHPAVLAKMAASIDRLSDGRLELGLGAGWNDREHAAFGVPYPPLSDRFEMLEESIKLTRALWTEDNVTFKGKHYHLDAVACHPKPVQKPPPPIIVGGNGKRCTLPIAAAYADEWNGTLQLPSSYRTRVEILRAKCEEIGRDPANLRCSLMVPLLIGRSESELGARLERIAGIMAKYPDMKKATPASLAEQGWLSGMPSQVVEQMQHFEEAGVERFMLQLFDYDDLEVLDIVAQDAMPQVDRS
ncbi:MAG: TIGR03560 family F420-dependent LLM class oxidoreductase [Dehalococcoidia bacterium]